MAKVHEPREWEIGEERLDVNRLKLEALQMFTYPDTGNIDQMFLQWLQRHPDVTADNLNDAQVQFLDYEFIPPGKLDDRWYQWLATQGQFGSSLRIRWYGYWYSCLMPTK